MVGGESNPDGSFCVTDSNGNTQTIFLEVKSRRSHVYAEQLERHLAVYCKEVNSTLFVISAYEADRTIAETISPKIIFKTWTEIASFLNKTTEEKLPSLFVEYGEQSGEFDMPFEVRKSDVEIYTQLASIKWEQRIAAVIGEACEHIRKDSKNYDATVRQQKAWGRHVAMITFPKKSDLDYGQWISVGFYLDTGDHGIPFKKTNTPELAFFLDMQPSESKKLPTAIKESLNLLVAQHPDFELNLDGSITTNRWRVLFKRVSLDAYAVVDGGVVSSFYNECMDTLKKYSALKNLVPKA